MVYLYFKQCSKKLDKFFHILIKNILFIRRDEEGQTMIEFAFMLPIILMLILGTHQLVLMYNAQSMANYAAYTACRVGIVNEGKNAAMIQAVKFCISPAMKQGGSTYSLKSNNASVTGRILRVSVTINYMFLKTGWIVGGGHRIALRGSCALPVELYD